MTNRSKLSAIAALACFITSGALAAAPDCSVSAASTWTAKPGSRFPVEAYSHGAECAQAVVEIIVREGGGRALWTDSAPAENVMIFGGIKTRAKMARALKEWISGEQMFKSSADLPPWKTGAGQPATGEFPFYPEAGVDRAHYEQVRAAKLPVFCYVQGMESEACIVLHEDGRMEKLGAQSFPG